ncbi:MAG: branched-chain amino acid transport system permease protein, partial [Glaciecola sp.]
MNAHASSIPRWLRLVLFAVFFGALPVVLNHTLDIGVVWYRQFASGAIFAMAALSLNLLMGYAGQISLGHTAFMAVGAYSAGLIVTTAQLSFVVGFMVAALVGALFALAIGLPALRLRGLLLAVTTLAFLFAVNEFLLNFSFMRSGSVGAILARPSIGPIDLQTNANYLAFVLVLLVGFLAIDGNITRSRLGRAFLGIREDEQVAASYGIDVARTKLRAFVLSGAMAGVAGAALGHLIVNTQSSEFRLDVSLAMVAWVIIGGLGSRAGVTVSAYLFGVFPYLFTQSVGWIDRTFEVAVFGALKVEEFSLVLGAALFLATVAVNPNGFVGNIKEKRDEKAAKLARAALAQGDSQGDDELLPSLPVPAARHGDVEPGT